MVTTGGVVIYDDLDHLAGTWNAQDIAEFKRATAGFEKGGYVEVSA